MRRSYPLRITRRSVIPEALLWTPPPRQAPLPPSVDMRKKWKGVYDQGDLGSCTANAVCGVLQLDAPQLDPSRLFLYYNERLLDNDVQEDAGSTLAQGVHALVVYGICPEKDWPYDTDRFTDAPTRKAYEDALPHKIYGYHHVPQDLDAMKQCLAEGMPFVLGVLVYSSFETEEVAKTGVVPLPDVDSEKLLGGHALCVAGYDDARESFLVRNSWGSGWGLEGYCYIPYTYLTDPSLTTDLWRIASCTGGSSSSCVIT